MLSVQHPRKKKKKKKICLIFQLAVYRNNSTINQHVVYGIVYKLTCAKSPSNMYTMKKLFHPFSFFSFLSVYLSTVKNCGTIMQPWLHSPLHSTSTTTTQLWPLTGQWAMSFRLGYRGICQRRLRATVYAHFIPFKGYSAHLRCIIFIG